MAIQAASAGGAVAAMASEHSVASIHCSTTDTENDVPPTGSGDRSRHNCFHCLSCTDGAAAGFPLDHAAAWRVMRVETTMRLGTPAQSASFRRPVVRAQQSRAPPA